MKNEEILKNRSTEQIIGGIHVLQSVLDYLYESLAEHIKTQDEFNTFAEKYSLLAEMPQTFEFVLESLREELFKRA